MKRLKRFDELKEGDKVKVRWSLLGGVPSSKLAIVRRVGAEEIMLSSEGEPDWALRKDHIQVKEAGSLIDMSIFILSEEEFILENL